MLGRRQAMLGGAALLAAGNLGGCITEAAGHSGLPVRQLGAITPNSLQDMRQFAQWLGRFQDHDLLYFNQESWERLEQSVSFITALGAGVLSEGRKVHWSIPAGGAAAYAEIADGRRDRLYREIARQIAAIYGSSLQRICVRLFWEFNMPEQTLAARGRDGDWQPGIYVAAFRRVAEIMRKVSDRFYFDWCPNVGEGGIAANLCYPGDEFVDVVSADIYYRATYDRQDHRDAGKAIFEYRRSQPFGLDWIADFAGQRNKLVGISEWGVDDDEAVAFMAGMCAWITELGDTLSHHNYWDRTDGGVVSRLSLGELPSLASIYQEAFA
jgi:Beta-mannanase